MAKYPTKNSEAPKGMHKVKVSERGKESGSFNLKNLKVKSKGRRK